MTTSDSSPQEKAAPADEAKPSKSAGQPKAAASTNEGVSASTSASAAAAGTSLKAGLVLVLVLLLLLMAGTGYLIKHNEPAARQLLSWNVQLPAWLLPPSLSQSGSDSGTGSAALAGSSSSMDSQTSPSGSSSTLGSEISSTPGSASADTSGPVSGAGVGFGQSASPPLPAPVTSPPPPIRPSPQLDPAFRSALNGIDQLARGLLALPAGPQKPSLPKAQTPRPSGSLLAGAETPASAATAVEGSNQAPTDPAQSQSTTVAPAMLEPGVFEKSLDFLRSLVRVQSVQGPEFAAHSQAFYQLVGQQMQAQLAAARLALLLGEVNLALRELSQTETLLDRHFDKSDPKVFQLQAEFAGLKRQVESLQ
jgi:uncharacterized protein HemX